MYCRQIRQIFCRRMHLLRKEAFVDGKWVGASSKKVFEVKNPADDSVVGVAPDMDADDARLAVEAASRAFKSWQSTTAKERSVLLRKWHDLLVENRNEIAAIMTAESGKPLAEALGEVAYGNSFVEWFSEEARRVGGEIVPSAQASKQILVYRQPIGPVALITPWNFPHAMIARKAGAALAAGCTCVIKPAEDTPLTALALARLAQEAGFPDGVVNVVTGSRGNAPAVGKVLCQSPDVAGVSFTGSTAVGKILYEQCAPGVKRIGLELGGNAPFVVFESADIANAVRGAVASKFRNCGQTCVSVNRFLVQESVFDDFVSRLSGEIERTIKQGNGKEDGVNLGPLINETQMRSVERMVGDAVSKGARVVRGGKPARALGDKFYEPTVLADITPDMEVYSKEIFGPIAVCVKFRTEDEALEIANGTNAGLASYLYTENIAQAFRVAKKLEFGMVGINEGIISTAEAPFGGIKESGIGREGGTHGMEDYLYIKYVCLGNM